MIGRTLAENCAACVCDEFEAYGYRRVGAELRHRGMVVNSKKIRRLMREHDLQPKRRRRFVATTDGDHDNPIFPELARDRIVNGPNQLWVADIISRSERGSSIWPQFLTPGHAVSSATRLERFMA
jgi:transposase InsO family protein